MTELLSQLPPAAPVARDAERVRQRCLAALKKPQRTRRSRLDGVLFAAAAMYLLSAVIQAITFFAPSVP